VNKDMLLNAGWISLFSLLAMPKPVLGFPGFVSDIKGIAKRELKTLKN